MTTRLASKWCLIITASAIGWAMPVFDSAATPKKLNETDPGQPADVEAFVREGCPHCARAEAFLAALRHEQPNLTITVRDVLKEPAAMERLKRLTENHGLAAVSVPAFFVGGQLIVGFSDEAGTGRLIRSSLAQMHPHGRETAKAPSCLADLPCDADAAAISGIPAISFFGRDLSPDQTGLPLFTLAMGLLDGFNPCSMWVLILMISLLASMNNRPRMFVIAGTFVAVQGIAYFAFLAAWLSLFLLIGISRASEIAIAAVAFLAGVVNLKDFLAFERGVSLSIPAAAKPGIYARMRRILHADNITGAVLGATALAILVQIVEVVCTSGFPALFTRVLTMQQLDTPSYYGYLLLYDLAYMLDDMLVLALGIITLSQRRLQEKEGRWLKLVSGLVMVGLSIYLLTQH